MPRCTNCGNHVTVQFARVFGDNEDTVHNCMACVPNAELDTSFQTDDTGREPWLQQWSQ